MKRTPPNRFKTNLCQVYHLEQQDDIFLLRKCFNWVFFRWRTNTFNSHKDTDFWYSTQVIVQVLINLILLNEKFQFKFKLNFFCLNSHDGGVPKFVVRCIEFIERNGFFQFPILCCFLMFDLSRRICLIFMWFLRDKRWRYFSGFSWSHWATKCKEFDWKRYTIKPTQLTLSKESFAVDSKLVLSFTQKGILISQVLTHLQQRSYWYLSFFVKNSIDK